MPPAPDLHRHGVMWKITLLLVLGIALMLLAGRLRRRSLDEVERRRVGSARNR